MTSPFPAGRASLRSRLIAACVVAIPLAAAPVAQAATCPTSRMVTAWAAAPTDALPQGFTNQTVRMIIRPHVSGSTIRVRLSNRFGSRGLRIGHATIAEQRRGTFVTPGAAIDLATKRELTFSGAAGTVIPQGQDAWSDEITIPAFSESTRLAVDLYLPEFTGSATKHYRGYRTSYLSIPGAGDLAGKNTGANGSSLATNFPSDRETDQVFFVNGLEVRKPGTWGTVVAFGDSLTDGTGSTVGQVKNIWGNPVDEDQRYPDWLQASLTAAGRKLSVANNGIAGNRLMYDAVLPYAGEAAKTRYVNDVLGQAGVTDVIVGLGANDLLMGGLTVNLINEYKQLIAKLHDAGLNVIVATIGPGGDTTGFLIGNRRAVVNDWIKATAKPHPRVPGDEAADAFFDYAAAITDPANPQGMNPIYDSGDRSHPNGAGYQKYVQTIGAAGIAKLKGPDCT